MKNLRNNKWKYILYSRIRRNNIIKMFILPKKEKEMLILPNANDRFNVIPIKIPMAFVTDI